MRNLAKFSRNTGFAKDVREDKAGRESFNTVFGDKIVVERLADVEEQFHYNISTSTLTTTVVASGTATSDADMAKLSTGSGTSASVILESKKTIRYRPGFEAWALFTVIFPNGGVANVVQHCGPVTSNDGYYIGYTGTNFVVGRRKGGTDTEVIAQNFNSYNNFLDEFDNTTLNIFRITFGWLGIATVTFEWKSPNDGWIILHQMKTENSLTGTTSNNPQLPIRFEVTKTSAGATDVIVRSGSWAGGVNGIDSGAGDRFFTGTVSATTVSTEAVLINFQNLTTFQSKTNRVTVKGVEVSLAVEGTKTGKVKIYKNLAIGGSPSWANIDATNSVMQKDTAGTVTPDDANLVFEYNLSKSGNITDHVGEINLELFPGDTITVTGQSAANMDFDFTFRWKELF